MQFQDWKTARNYILAGHGTITVCSKKTGQRFTFKCGMPKEKTTFSPIFVKVLTGTDNESDYSFLGTLFPETPTYPESTFRLSPKSRISKDSPSAVAAVWFFTAVAKDKDILESATVYHSGQCGRCGRKLTVPESIESGIGPECAKKQN